ncbi:hypothetical protein [Rhizobium sp. BK251]|uniref:hypothetical protein n=1 Tax=Rhizobium sp. BK251 TaxID=2512125 RepID=UPI00104B6690|nr:hypothetical protein [Rhizobium sp. BK251]TCL69839.1 hypothetical protein EV286_108417 [Rhizobium sp. BK251]
MEQKIERNRQIVEMRSRGMTFAAIGKAFDISQYRVKAICDDYAYRQMSETTRNVLSLWGYQVQA